MPQNSHDYFKNMRKLFEATEVNEISDATAAASTKKREQNRKDGKDPDSKKLLNNYKQTDDREVRKTPGQSSSKRPSSVKENRFAADNPDMDDDDIRDHLERKQEKADDKRKADKEESGKDKKKDTKESAAGMMRKYADFLNEAKKEIDPWVKDNNKKIEDKRALAKARADLASAKTGSAEEKSLTKKINDLMKIVESAGDDDEDPDVAKAYKVKGKDGKTQKEAEKDLPLWINGKNAFKKKDEKDEEKGVKKTRGETNEGIGANDDDRKAAIKKIKEVRAIMNSHKVGNTIYVNKYKNHRSVKCYSPEGAREAALLADLKKNGFDARIENRMYSVHGGNSIIVRIPNKMESEVDEGFGDFAKKAAGAAGRMASKIGGEPVRKWAGNKLKDIEKKERGESEKTKPKYPNWRAGDEE